MICPNCKNSVHKYKTHYTKRGNVVTCSYCSNGYVPEGQLNFRQGSFVYSPTGKMTAAHNEDISHRRLAEDRVHVERHYNKRYFTLK